MSISLMKVLDQIGEIATANGQKFYAVQSELEHASSGRVTVKFKGYIQGANWYYADTPEGVLNQLKAYYGMVPLIDEVTEDIIIPEPWPTQKAETPPHLTGMRS